MTTEYHHEQKMQEYYPAKRVESYFIPIGSKSRIPKKAETILGQGSQCLLGRKIVTFLSHHGDYGDGGGPGFLGFLLGADSKKNLKKEWLIITIGCADSFTLLDNNWMYASTPFRKTHVALAERPAIGQPSVFELIIKDSVIQKVDLQSEFLKIRIQSTDGKEHLLEILNKDSRLSPYANLKPAVAMRPGDHIGNYIIFMDEEGQIFV